MSIRGIARPPRGRVPHNLFLHVQPLEGGDGTVCEMGHTAAHYPAVCHDMLCGSQTVVVQSGDRHRKEVHTAEVRWGMTVDATQSGAHSATKGPRSVNQRIGKPVTTAWGANHGAASRRSARLGRVIG